MDPWRQRSWRSYSHHCRRRCRCHCGCCSHSSSYWTIAAIVVEGVIGAAAVLAGVPAH
jgi:hypothetical protein